jgi:hypothetical protein
VPYLDADNRARVERDGPTQPGDLNYTITRVALYYLKRKMCGGKLTYALLSEVKGAMQDAVDEFDRRLMTPYEEVKIATNGDVYDVLDR